MNLFNQRLVISLFLYVTANEKSLFNRNENAIIDANSMISTFIADHSHSDRMCALGIS